MCNERGALEVESWAATQSRQWAHTFLGVELSQRSGYLRARTYDQQPWIATRVAIRQHHFDLVLKLVDGLSGSLWWRDNGESKDG